MAEPVPQNRPLTTHEQRLARWMLEHGKPEASSFLPQLALATVTPWRCPCGCASINFAVEGYPAPTGGGIHVLGDFLFGDGDEVSGTFIFEKNGVLAGIEVYGLAGDAPRSLPEPEALRPVDAPIA